MHSVLEEVTVWGLFNMPEQLIVVVILLCITVPLKFPFMLTDKTICSVCGAWIRLIFSEFALKAILFSQFWKLILTEKMQSLKWLFTQLKGTVGEGKGRFRF